MEMNFCRRCGAKASLVNDHVFRCENGHTLFANSSPTVGVFLVTQDDELLMTVRGIEPHKGTLDIVGGFLDQAETFEETIYRELKEETSLSPIDISTPAYLMTTTNNYAFNGEDIPVVSPIFWARLKPSAQPTPLDDVADFALCTFDELAERDLYPGDLLRASVKLRNILEK